MTQERKRDVTPPEPVAALAMVDRRQLHVSLKPTMTDGSFTNWLTRAKKLGFPEPIRTGQRSCSWLLSEVQAWLASRPRKGTFDGKRRGAQARA